jgi:acyl dehydratase
LVVSKKASGKKSKPSTYRVTKEKIKEFVEAVGDGNPLYVDEQYARKTKFGGIIAPPTFIITCSFWAPQQVSQPVRELTGARAIIHGEQELEYFKPIRPEDIITFTTRVVDTYTKTGRTGVLDFVVSETVFKNQFGEKVVVGRSTRIVRR